jgi:hypothetical protein
LRPSLEDAQDRHEPAHLQVLFAALQNGYEMHLHQAAKEDKPSLGDEPTPPIERNLLY